jgi:hypothetical protein
MGLICLAILLLFYIDRKKKFAAKMALTDSRSAFEIALEEVELDQTVSSLWTEAYAHTEDEESRKKYYVRERAKILTSLAEPNLRSIGVFGWIFVVAFYVVLWTMAVGELAFIQETKRLVTLIPDEKAAFILASISISIRVFIFLIIHKLISGHAFGKWPERKTLRPRTFLAIWVGLFSTFLVNSAQNYGLYLYDPNWSTAKESVGMVIVNVSTFLMYCLAGLVIAFLYKIKVR